jgi:hypothetical protein
MTVESVFIRRHLGPLAFVSAVGAAPAGARMLVSIVNNPNLRAAPPWRRTTGATDARLGGVEAR